jgi:hypothetical protein
MTRAERQGSQAEVHRRWRSVVEKISVSAGHDRGREDLHHFTVDAIGVVLVSLGEVKGNELLDTGGGGDSRAASRRQVLGGPRELSILF